MFDEVSKQMLGMMFTPPIRFDHINRYAKEMYGNRAIGLNLDGDFYAGMLDLRNINAKTIDNKDLTQRVEMYYQQSGMCLVKPSANPKINQLPKSLLSVAQKKADERREDDKQADVWKQIFGFKDKVMNRD